MTGMGILNGEVLSGDLPSKCHKLLMSWIEKWPMLEPTPC